MMVSTVTSLAMSANVRSCRKMALAWLSRAIFLGKYTVRSAGSASWNLSRSKAWGERTTTCSPRFPRAMASSSCGKERPLLRKALAKEK